MDYRGGQIKDTGLKGERMKHRKLPWYVMNDEYKEGCFYIASSIDAELEDIEICSVWNKWTEDQGKANAEFIVKACNAHYELLDICEHIFDSVVQGDAVLEDIEQIKGLKEAIAKATQNE